MKKEYMIVLILIDMEQRRIMRKSVCPANDNWNSVRKSSVTFSVAVGQ